MSQGSVVSPSLNYTLGCVWGEEEEEEEEEVKKDKVIKPGLYVARKGKNGVKR